MHATGIFLRQGGRTLSLLEYMDRVGIARAAVTTVQEGASMKTIETAMEVGDSTGPTGGPEDPTQAAGGPGAPDPFEAGFSREPLPHDDVKALMRAAPDRIFGFYWFNPRGLGTGRAGDDPFRPLERALQHEGFVGVKLHPTIDQPAAGDLRYLAEYLVHRGGESGEGPAGEPPGVPLYVHLCPGFFRHPGLAPTDLLPLARAFPTLPIIVGHFAYAMEACIEAIFVARQCPNVYLDTSLAIPFGIFSAYRALGAARLVYGSDCPTATPAPPEIAKVQMLRVPAVDKRAIFHDNLAALLLPPVDE